jgi:hypothetical protein
MARKQNTIIIDTDNRDKGKTYLIKEMDAFSADKWAFKALSAINMSNVDLSFFGGLDSLTKSGMQGVFEVSKVLGGVINLLQSIDEEKLDTIIDDLHYCCYFIPTPGAPPRPIMDKIDGDIEEVSTLFKLKVEALVLHLDFLKAASSRTTGG